MTAPQTPQDQPQDASADERQPEQSRWAKWYALNGATLNARRAAKRASDADYRARVQQTERSVHHKRLAAVRAVQSRVESSRFGVPGALYAALAHKEPGKRRKRVVGLFYRLSDVSRFWGVRVRVFLAAIHAGRVEAPLYEQIHGRAEQPASEDAGETADHVVGSPTFHPQIALYAEEQLHRILAVYPRIPPRAVASDEQSGDLVYPAFALLRYLTGLGSTTLRRLHREQALPYPSISFLSPGVDRVSPGYTVKHGEAVARVLLRHYALLTRRTPEDQKRDAYAACRQEILAEWQALQTPRRPPESGQQGTRT